MFLSQSKEYRGDIPKTTAETFFRKVKFWKGEAPPVFVRRRATPARVSYRTRALTSHLFAFLAPPLQNVDGVNYLFTKKNGIYFVSTTKFNVSPSFILELLERVAKVRPPPHRPSTRAANSLAA